mgnify:CR=1 FL=1
MNGRLELFRNITGSSTQKVERMWREVKRFKIRYQGINSEEIDSHVSEYLWRTKNNITQSNAFPKAILLIRNCPYY